MKGINNRQKKVVIPRKAYKKDKTNFITGKRKTNVKNKNVRGSS